jgi:hypothetical protein
LERDARERRARAEEERRIEKEIELIHARLEREAKMTIIQCAVRAFLACRRAKKRRFARQNRELVAWEEKRLRCTITIQRVFRGYR